MHAVLDEMGAHLESKLDTIFFKVDCVEAGPTETAKIFSGSTWACRHKVMQMLEELHPPRRSVTDDRFDVIRVS